MSMLSSVSRPDAVASTADPIPAIREEDATGEVAAIFADLRATLGIPFVNLIWRHFPTIPGALPWAWAMLKPLYQSPELARCGAALRSGIALPDVSPVPAFAWDVAGVGAKDRTAIRALVEDYNRANSINLLTMLVAKAVLDPQAPPPPKGLVSGEASTRSDLSSPVAPGPTPSLLALTDLPPALLDLVRAFDRLGRLGESVALASLYRHLAHWPGYLALSYAVIARYDANGRLQDEQQGLLASARRFAATDLIGLRGPESVVLAEDSRNRVSAVLDEFTGLMIGRMTVMGAALAAILPDEA